MPDIHIPPDVLLNLAPRLSALFADIHSDDVDTQYLYAALMAAAGMGSSLSASDHPDLPPVQGLSTPASQPASPPSSPLLSQWGQSSPTLGPLSSRASSLEPPVLNLDGDEDDGSATPFLPDNSRKRKLTDADDLSDDPGHLLANNLSGSLRESLAARDERMRLRQVAREVDADRVAAREAVRLRGGWGDPDCHRAGDRYWAAQALAPAELQAGLPMVPGPEGLATDPSLAQEDGYSAGVGTQNAGEVVGGGVDLEEPEIEGSEVEEVTGKKGKGKGKKRDWRQTVQKVVLKKDAGQLIASLTSISCARPERGLFALVQRLTSTPSPSANSDASPGWVIGASASTTTPIASLVSKIEHTTVDARSNDFQRMIMLMQLSILVD